MLPRPQSEQGQPDVCEHPGALDPTGFAHELSGGSHVGGVGRIACQPQGNVGLDRGREVGRATVEVGPCAVRALARPDPPRGRGQLGGVARPEELAQQQILGVHGDVRLELTAPEPVRVLA